MKTENKKDNSQLIASLREGVSIVQMVVFKEIRDNLQNTKTAGEKDNVAMLSGSITNEIFGTQNPEEKFARFRKEHWGEIEQQLLKLSEDLSKLCAHITDALRIQTLCDHQQGGDSSVALVKAKEHGFLIEEREIPLPSSLNVW